MSPQPSGYESFDRLNQQAAIATGAPTAGRPPSRFSSALSSINQFLQTATDTIVTVDGVINKDKDSMTMQPLYPVQHTVSAPKGSSMLTYLAIAGLAVGGGLIAFKTLKK